MNSFISSVSLRLLTRVFLSKGGKNYKIFKSKRKIKEPTIKKVQKENKKI